MEQKNKKPIFKVGVVHHNFYSLIAKDIVVNNVPRHPKGVRGVKTWPSPPKRINRATQTRLAAKTAASAAATPSQAGPSSATASMTPSQPGPSTATASVTPSQADPSTAAASVTSSQPGRSAATASVTPSHAGRSAATASVTSSHAGPSTATASVTPSQAGSSTATARVTSWRPGMSAATASVTPSHAGPSAATNPSKTQGHTRNITTRTAQLVGLRSCLRSTKRPAPYPIVGTLAAGGGGGAPLRDSRGGSRVLAVSVSRPADVLRAT